MSTRFRSPAARNMSLNSSTSSIARTQRDQDDLIAELRKENFNLKLRIYEMEDNLSRMAPGDVADAIKQVVDLRVELESARKQLEEQNDLLAKAQATLDDYANQEERRMRQLREQAEHELHQAHLRIRELQLASKEKDAALESERTQWRKHEQALRREVEQLTGSVDDAARTARTADARWRDEVRQLEQQISSRDSTLARQQMELKEMHTRLAAAHADVATLSETAGGLRSEQQRESAREASLERELDELRQQLQAARDDKQALAADKDRLASECRALQQTQREHAAQASAEVTLAGERAQLEAATREAERQQLDAVHARQEAERKQQDIERAQQEAERARQEAERTRQAADEAQAAAAARHVELEQQARALEEQRTRIQRDLEDLEQRRADHARASSAPRGDEHAEARVRQFEDMYDQSQATVTRLREELARAEQKLQHEQQRVHFKEDAQHDRRQRQEHQEQRFTTHGGLEQQLHAEEMAARMRVQLEALEAEVAHKNRLLTQAADKVRTQEAVNQAQDLTSREYESALHLLRRQVEDLEDDLVRWRGRAESAESKLDLVEEELGTIRRDVAAAEDAHHVLLCDLRTQCAQQEATIRGLERDLEALHVRLGEAADGAEDSRREQRSTQDALGDARQRISELTSSLEAALSAAAGLEDAQQRVRELEAANKALLRSVGDAQGDAERAAQNVAHRDDQLEQLQARLRNAEDEARGLERQLHEAREEHKVQLSCCQDDVETLRSRLATCDAKLADTAAHNRSLQTEVRDLEGIVKVHKQIAEDKDDVIARHLDTVADKERVIQRLKDDIERLRTTMMQADEELAGMQELRTALADAERQISSLSSEVGHVRATCEAQAERVEQLRAQLQNCQVALQDERRKLADAERQRVDDVSTWERDMQALRADCERMQRHKSELETLLHEREAELEALHGDNDGLARALREHAQLLEGAAATERTLCSELEHVRGRHVGVEAELQQAQADNSAMQAQLDEMAAELENASSLYECEIVRIKERLKVADQAVARAEPLGARAEELGRDIKRISTQLETVTNERDSIRGDADKLRVQLNSAMEDLSEERLVVDEMRSELETLLADRDALEQRLEDLEARRVAEQEDSQAIIAELKAELAARGDELHKEHERRRVCELDAERTTRDNRALREEVQRQREAIRQLRAREAELLEDQKLLHDDLDAAAKKIRALEVQLDDLEVHTRQQLRAKADEAGSAVREVRGCRAELDAALQQLEEAARDNTLLTQSVADLEEALAQRELRFEEAVRTRDTYEQQVRGLRDKLAEYSDAQLDHRDVVDQVVGQAQRSDVLVGRLRGRLQDTEEELLLTRERIQLQKDAEAALQERLARAEDELEALRKSESQAMRCQGELDRMRLEAERKDRDNISLRAELERLVSAAEKDALTMNDLVTSLQKLRAEQRRLRSEVEDAEMRAQLERNKQTAAAASASADEHVVSIRERTYTHSVLP